MVKWVFNRVADILLAVLAIIAVLWFMLTQPLFWVAKQSDTSLLLDRYALELGLRELLAIPASTEDPQARFNATSAYLAKQLAGIGAVEQADRPGGQKVLRLRVGQGTEKRLFVVLHYVVTDKPMLDIAKSAVSLIEVARAIAKEPEVAMQLSLTIFLHHTPQLAKSLNDVSLYHADQLVQAGVVSSPMLLFMPALRLPEAAYTTGQWRYFSVLLPDTDNELAIYGRLNDMSLLRSFKTSLAVEGLADIDSISIPVNFPGMQPSPLKFYWDNDQPAMLVSPNILLHDTNYDGHAHFISALYNLAKKGI